MKKTYLAGALALALIATTGLFVTNATQEVSVTLDTTANVCTFGDYTIDGLSVSFSAQNDQLTSTPAFDCDMFDQSTSVDTTFGTDLIGSGNSVNVIPVSDIELTVTDLSMSSNATFASASNGYDNMGSMPVEFLSTTVPQALSGTSQLSIDIPAALPADVYKATMTITY